MQEVHNLSVPFPREQTLAGSKQTGRFLRQYIQVRGGEATAAGVLRLLAFMCWWRGAATVNESTNERFYPSFDRTGFAEEVDAGVLAGEQLPRWRTHAKHAGRWGSRVKTYFVDGGYVGLTGVH